MVHEIERAIDDLIQGLAAKGSYPTVATQLPKP
jgi:hypothetical protein